MAAAYEKPEEPPPPARDRVKIGVITREEYHFKETTVPRSGHSDVVFFSFIETRFWH